MDKNMPIGVFDSGLGGISVLRECVKELPRENFIYFGDSANAPYGTRSKKEIQKLSLKAAELLMDKGIKALLVACNTASSIAGEILREKYPDFIIVEIEPALKPAVTDFPKGRIVVMATPTTLREEKFANLLGQYSQVADICKLPCPGLPEFVERGELDSVALENYLQKTMAQVKEKPIDAIVLGCTHYPFVEKMIKKVAGYKTIIYDGSGGTARQLRRRLDSFNLLNDDQSCGNISWLNSSNTNEIILLSQKLFSVTL